MCIPILVITFPEWLCSMESLSYTLSAVRLPSCVCSVLRVHAQFCRFDMADTTADIQ